MKIFWPFFIDQIGLLCSVTAMFCNGSDPLLTYIVLFELSLLSFPWGFKTCLSELDDSETSAHLDTVLYRFFHPDFLSSFLAFPFSPIEIYEGFHTLIKGVLFSFPTNVGDHVFNQEDLHFYI